MNSLKGKMWWLGLVVILALGGNLGAFQATQPAPGTLKWRFKTGGAVVSSPAIDANGTIYFGSNDLYLYALNSSSLGVANSPWPMFRHDPQRTGRASGSRR
jgi:outer membrane protein assembly factor BamB